MTRALAFVFLLAACGGEKPVVVTVDDDSELTPEVVEPDQEEIPPMGGNLPPGFNARGCQWDNPACGQPTPGGQQAINPIREDAR